MSENKASIIPALEPLTITVGLGLEAHSQAEHFRAYQPDPDKAKQVYLNTLAVYAVNVYLQCREFETDLENSTSWDPVMQMLMDTADLMVKNRGKLECRPVLPDAEVVCVPAEVWAERIGYVAVQLSESLREATLLGFVEKVARSELPLSQLRSLQELPGYLNNIRPLVNLSQWFENVFEAGWQALEALLDTQSPDLALNFRSPGEAVLDTQPSDLALSFRSPGEAVLDTQPSDLALNFRSSEVRRCKLVELATPDQSVAMIVVLTGTSEQEMDIRVEVQPPQGQAYLPLNLQLMLLDEDGETVIDAYTRSDNKTIQLEFSGESGDHFSVKVALGNVSVTENFII